MPGNGNPIDLTGLPPQVLYALIEMLSRTVQTRDLPEPFGAVPFGPGEMDALNRYGLQSPRMVEPTSPGNVRDLLNRSYGWGDVMPRGNYGNP